MGGGKGQTKVRRNLQQLGAGQGKSYYIFGNPQTSLLGNASNFLRAPMPPSPSMRIFGGYERVF